MSGDDVNRDIIHDIQTTSDEAARLLAELETDSNSDGSLNSQPTSTKSDPEVYKTPPPNSNDTLESLTALEKDSADVHTGLIVGSVIIGLIVLISIVFSISPPITNTSRTDDSRLSPNASNSSNIPYGKAKYKSGRTGKTEIIGVKLSKRTNSNGHIAYDALWDDGYKSSYLFWRSGRAEIFSKNGSGNIERTRARFRRTQNGDCVITAETNAVTTFPNFSPRFN